MTDRNLGSLCIRRSVRLLFTQMDGRHCNSFVGRALAKLWLIPTQRLLITLLIILLGSSAFAGQRGDRSHTWKAFLTPRYRPPHRHGGVWRSRRLPGQSAHPAPFSVLASQSILCACIPYRFLYSIPFPVHIVPSLCITYLLCAHRTILVYCAPVFFVHIVPFVAQRASLVESVLHHLRLQVQICDDELSTQRSPVAESRYASLVPAISSYYEMSLGTGRDCRKVSVDSFGACLLF